MFGLIVTIAFKLVGALALFLYGMQLTSDGIQRAAGDRLQRAVNLMTKNRFIAVLTGTIVTILIQSSSATTVMVVSFVNAGLLSLIQAIGVIMGANIGTTLTGWIIAVAGVGSFSISLIAVPIFGIGYLLSLMKNRGDSFVGYGEGLMGFAMIFLGLDFLSAAIPTPSPEILVWLHHFSSGGMFTVVLCVIVGALFTMAIHASSATLAIVIGLACKGVLTFEMAAALTLGANIGTTIDSFLAGLGSGTAAKRAAWAHIMFNVIGTVWVVIVFKPFLSLLQWIVPGEVTSESIGFHIAMMHTMFNLANTIVLLPFIKQYAAMLEKMIKPKASEIAASKLTYKEHTLLATPELNIIKARQDIKQMAAVTEDLFIRVKAGFKDTDCYTAEAHEDLCRHVAYVTQIREGLSKFLIDVARQDVTEKTRDNIGVMIRLCTDFDNISKCCENLSCLLEKGTRKKITIGKEEDKQLDPYTQLVLEFLRFVNASIDRPMTEVELTRALEFEDRIDAFRAELKKLSRKRIGAGADVKAELHFIDVIRYIERIGDYSYSVAKSLRETR